MRDFRTLVIAMLGIGLAAPALAAPPAPDGSVIFRQRCQACHSVEAGKKSSLGPDLRAVVGRKAASTDFKYSPALKGSDLTWTPANLDRFLTAPTKMVPGTRMVMAISDQAQRKAVIDYLKQAR